MKAAISFSSDDSCALEQAWLSFLNYTIISQLIKSCQDSPTVFLLQWSCLFPCNEGFCWFQLVRLSVTNFIEFHFVTSFQSQNVFFNFIYPWTKDYPSLKLSRKSLFSSFPLIQSKKSTYSWESIKWLVCLKFLKI